MWNFINLIIMAAWICLASMVWKKKTELAESHYKLLKRFLVVGGISFAGPIAIFIGCKVYDAIWGMPDGDLNWIALPFLMVFFISTIGGWILFLIGRSKTA